MKAELVEYAKGICGQMEELTKLMADAASKTVESAPSASTNNAMVPCPHWVCLDDCVWQDEKSGAKVTCSDVGPCSFRARHQ